MHEKAPSADDPGYLERLKGNPPLDKWVDPSSSSWQAQVAKERHRERMVQLEVRAQIIWLSRHLGHSSVQVTSSVYGRWARGARGGRGGPGGCGGQAQQLAGAFGI